MIILSGLTSNSVSGFTVTTPPSIRGFSFKLTTYYVSNSIPYAIETKTMNCQNNPGIMTTASVSASNTQVNQITVYTITFTIINRLAIGSMIDVVFPSQLVIQIASASCSISGHTCVVKSNSNVSVTLSSAVVGNTQLIITVNNVMNAN